MVTVMVSDHIRAPSVVPGEEKAQFRTLQRRRTDRRKRHRVGLITGVLSRYAWRGGRDAAGCAAALLRHGNGERLTGIDQVWISNLVLVGLVDYGVSDAGAVGTAG